MVHTHTTHTYLSWDVVFWQLKVKFVQYDISLIWKNNNFICPRTSITSTCEIWQCQTAEMRHRYGMYSLAIFVNKSRLWGVILCWICWNEVGRISSMSVHGFTCVTLTPYIKGPPGTLYCIKAQLAGVYLSARPLTWESYDRYMLPSLLLGNCDTNCISYPNVVHMGDKALTLRCCPPLVSCIATYWAWFM